MKNKIMKELYTFTIDRISATLDYQEKIRALAIAKMAILDGERQELRE